MHRNFNTRSSRALHATARRRLSLEIRPLEHATFLTVAILLGIIFLMGCKPKNEAPKKDTAQRGEVIRKTQLQTDLDRAVELPLERDPAKRPLILSQPAPNKRQWAIQALNTGYLKRGKGNSAWDTKVATAFEAFADYSRVSTTNWPALEKALVALATTACDDPMVQYMQVRYRGEGQSKEKKASQFIHAHDALWQSEYHPVFKFFAGLRAEESARAADRKSNRRLRIERTTADLEDLARDTNAPVEEVFEAAFMWLDQSHSREWIEHVTSDLSRILEQNWGRTEQRLRFQGDVEVWRAWGERGGGWSSTVNEKGWKGFEEHLGKGEQFLTKAWQMNPSNSHTAYLMMQVELGQGKGLPRMESWFSRAMSLDTNYYDAVKLMSFYLEPRWYGSEEKALTFGRACVASQKWGGNVPLILANLHHSLAKYSNLSNSPAYWHDPQVWRDVKSSYEKFFARNPGSAGWRHDYAMDAYNCGEYQVFLEQTKLFGLSTNYSFFGGEESFQRMLATATAAARPAKK